MTADRRPPTADGSRGDPDSRPGDASGAERAPRGGRSIRWLYVRVLLVQAVTLVLLWLLQAGFGG